jgi:myo-inositol-1-phosphate synthase
MENERLAQVGKDLQKLIKDSSNSPQSIKNDPVAEGVRTLQGLARDRTLWYSLVSTPARFQ